MPETTQDHNTPVDVMTQGQEPEAKVTPKTDPAPATDPRAAQADPDDAPEWAKKKIQSLNGENAGWRTQLREAQDALKAAKSPEDFAAVVTDFEAKLVAKDRQIVSATHGLPPELADLLKGNTLEELTAHAKVLQKFAAPPSSDDEELAGGLNPASKAGATDPASMAKRINGTRKRHIR